MASVPITQNLQFLSERVGDISKMSDDMGGMIASMTQMQALMVKFSEAMHTTVGSANGMVDSAHRSVADMNTMKVTLDQMRDHIADFDDAVHGSATTSTGTSTASTSRLAGRARRSTPWTV